MVPPYCKTEARGVSIRTLRGGKVDDVAVALEHVHLLDSLDGLNIDLLKGGLELLVIASGAGRRSLDLSAGSTLATISFQKKSPLSEIKSPLVFLSAFACFLSSFAGNLRGKVLCGGYFEGARADGMEG